MRLKKWKGLKSSKKKWTLSICLFLFIRWLLEKAFLQKQELIFVIFNLFNDKIDLILSFLLRFLQPCLNLVYFSVKVDIRGPDRSIRRHQGHYINSPSHSDFGQDVKGSFWEDVNFILNLLHLFNWSGPWYQNFQV